MSLRLPHVLILMGLILAAGVVSARHLQGDVGATVPGVVVVEAPALDAGDFTALLAQLHVRATLVMIPGVHDGSFAPFDDALAARRSEEGAATALVSARARPEPSRRSWRVVIADPPTGGDLASALHAADVAAEFVRGQTGLRAFLVALDPGPVPAFEITRLLAPLLDAADALPTTRRTSIVLLGERDPATGQRTMLRFDRGSWGGRARSGLADLLEDAW